MAQGARTTKTVSQRPFQGYVAPLPSSGYATAGAIVGGVAAGAAMWTVAVSGGTFTFGTRVRVALCLGAIGAVAAVIRLRPIEAVAGFGCATAGMFLLTWTRRVVGPLPAGVNLLAGLVWVCLALAPLSMIGVVSPTVPGGTWRQRFIDSLVAWIGAAVLTVFLAFTALVMAFGVLRFAPMAVLESVVLAILLGLGLGAVLGGSYWWIQGMAADRRRT